MMGLIFNIKRAASLLFLFVTVVALFACGEASRDNFKLSGSTMGTTYHVTVVRQAEDKLDQQQLQQAIDQQLQQINQQMSTYIADSELVKLNNAPVGEWVVVSENLFNVLMMSLELGWLSNGAFDITMGPLVELWGFGASVKADRGAIPSANQIQSALKNVGYQHIEFDITTNSIRKQLPVRLDLSAIAKGFGVDKVAELLLYAGYKDFMVEIGGELRLQGSSPRGTPWRIGIEQPDALSVGEVYSSVSVSGVAMATSGEYRNYFERDGRRYSHTLDPLTGYPIDHRLVSVTVIADSAAYADGLATVINVLGAEKGLELAAKQDLAVYMINKTAQGFKAVYSDAFKPYLNK